MRRAWVDGVLVGEDRAPPDPLHRGRGLFETILVRDGRPLRLAEHLARLYGSAAELGVPAPRPPGEVAAAARALAAATRPGEARMRIALDRGRTVITAAPFAGHPPARQAGGARAEIAARPGHPLGDRRGWKVLPYAPLLAAREEARALGAVDVIFREEDGALLEGAASNLFLGRGGVLLTPPLSRGILPGITRNAVIRAAREAGIPVKERDVFPADLASAEEAFLTGSLMEVLPLRRLGEVPLRPGPLAAELGRRLRHPTGLPSSRF